VWACLLCTELGQREDLPLGQSGLVSESFEAGLLKFFDNLIRVWNDKPPPPLLLLLVISLLPVFFFV
jgi:hypothetical protein